MKRIQIAPLVLGLLFAATTGLVNAQGVDAKAEAPLTRTQVKMERDEFLRTHQWDVISENWVLKSGVEAPVGMKSRAEIKAERDEFLRNNRWDDPTSSWVSLKGAPRDVSKMTREQVRAETAHFVRTHEWNETTQAWVEKPSTKKK